MRAFVNIDGQHLAARAKCPRKRNGMETITAADIRRSLAPTNLEVSITRFSAQMLAPLPIGLSRLPQECAGSHTDAVRVSFRLRGAECGISPASAPTAMRISISWVRAA